MNLEKLEAIHTEIKSKWKKYEEYALAKNVDGVLEILSDDPILVITAAGKFVSREPLKTVLEGTVAHLKEIKAISKDIYDVEDKIYEFGTISEVFLVDGKEITMKGGYVSIWIKVNGSWKVSEMLATPNPE